ncbi:MAG TPA: uroporphyrinogen-III C-methyltransferase [Luteibacter sp.]|jgi:uroporphyrin-3 C-methyltransferase|uniref:uroporphyrinogen-III C-methyltransferase n=1 Tax=Luteibacter sp. TaxID=1886636 RepID=UPI002F41B8E9
MTTETPPTESAPATPGPAAPAPAAGTRRSPDPAPRRGGGALAIAVLLSLAAAGVAGYTAWTVWNLREDVGATNGLKGQVDTLQAAVNGLRDDNANLRRRLSDADGVNRSAREEVLGMAERTKNLEDAVANLSERSLSGHDAMLLDEAESLLRMAKERFALFGDASGALAAYDLADKSLASVNDSAFAAVRQNLGAEREALVAVQPKARASDLATLADLRAQIATLPLKDIDTQAGADEERTFWQRAGNALGSIVRISHDEGTPLGLADDRLARELAALDVAHAEAAVLAYDDRARAAALKRVDATLVAHFNNQAPSVQTARQRIATLLASQATGVEPKLGAALEELRSLRSVHALKASAPAHATSAASVAPAEPAPATSTAKVSP